MKSILVHLYFFIFVFLQVWKVLRVWKVTGGDGVVEVRVVVRREVVPSQVSQLYTRGSGNLTRSCQASPRESPRQPL